MGGETNRRFIIRPRLSALWYNDYEKTSGTFYVEASY